MAYAKGEIVVLDDARLWFDKKTKQVYFASTDPDLGGGGFRMPIKSGSPLEQTALKTLRSMGVLSEDDEARYPALDRTWPSISIGRTASGEDVRIGPEDAHRFNGVPDMLVTCADKRRRSDFMSFLANELPRSGADALLIRGVHTNPLYRPSVWSTLRRGQLVLDDAALAARPGCLDPLLNIADPYSAARLLMDMIMQGTRMSQGQGVVGAQRRAWLGQEIQERVLDTRTQTSHDVIFGNAEIEPISDEGLRSFVSNALKTRSLWSALLSTNAEVETLRAEIDRRGLSVIDVPGIPAAEVPASDLSDTEVDALSVATSAYVLATENMQQYGGAVLLDAERVLMFSQVAMTAVVRAGRTWRQRATVLVVGTADTKNFGPESKDAHLFDRFIDLGDVAGSAHLKDNFIAWEGDFRPGNEM